MKTHEPTMTGTKTLTSNQIIILFEAYKYQFTEKRIDSNDWITLYWANTIRSLYSKGLLNRINKNVYEITELGVQTLKLELNGEYILEKLLSSRWKVESIMNRWFR